MCESSAVKGGQKDSRRVGRRCVLSPQASHTHVLSSGMRASPGENCSGERDWRVVCKTAAGFRRGACSGCTTECCSAGKRWKERTRESACPRGDATGRIAGPSRFRVERASDSLPEHHLSRLALHCNIATHSPSSHHCALPCSTLRASDRIRPRHMR